jgi:hypothetical protein
MDQAMEPPEPDRSLTKVHAAGCCVGTVPHRDLVSHTLGGRAGSEGWPVSQRSAGRNVFQKDRLRAYRMMISM